MSDGPDPADAPGPADPELYAIQRRRLRRILSAFVFVVVVLPFAAIGGRWSLLLLPLVLAAAFALHEALLLRRAQR